MKLFDRIASVTFGPEGTEDGVQVNDLRIAFSVSKNLKPETNTATVTIYNLSAGTHNKLEVGEVMILKAGYKQGESEPPVLGLGTIKSVKKLRREADLLSEIVLEDGLLQLRQKRLSVTYAEGTSAGEVMQAAITGLELDAYPLPDYDASIQYVNGLSFEGPARELMSKVCKKLGLEWSVQTGKVLVVPKGGTGQIEAVLLNNMSGLISTPEKIASEANELEPDEEKKPDGWTLSSLLRAEFVPGGTVTIQSDTANGSYRIEEVKHTGDTHGDDWTSTLTVREAKEAA